MALIKSPCLLSTTGNETEFPSLAEQFILSFIRPTIFVPHSLRVLKVALK